MIKKKRKELTSHDVVLARSISRLEGRRERYIRAKDAISNNYLDSKRNLKYLRDYIDHCDSLIQIIDGDAGYAYLSNFRTKLQADKDTLEEYYTYCTDANSSFTNLYIVLKEEISSLNSQISAKKSEYNEGKPPWEWIW